MEVTGGVLCCGPDGGAFRYYTTGIGNAFRCLGVRFEQWNGSDVKVLRDLRPRIYLACSEAWRHGYPDWARKEFGTKLLVHANPFGGRKVGSVDGGPVIDAKPHDISWTVAQRPDGIICYASGEASKAEYYRGWQAHAKVYALPLAADHTVYGLGTATERFNFDVGWVGGMWPYKQKMMSRFLLPLRQKYRCGFFGWNDPWHMGRLADDEVKNLFRSAKICPAVSESHSVSHPIDVPERVYKVPYAGGFTVHTPTPALQELGLAGVIPVAQDERNWFALIEHYLHNDEERRRKAAEQRQAILSGHTYLHRITELVRDFFPELSTKLEQAKASLA